MTESVETIFNKSVEIRARKPMKGVLSEWNVIEGETFPPNTVLATLRHNTDTHELKLSQSGIVRKLCIQPGKFVQYNEILAIIVVSETTEERFNTKYIVETITSLLKKQVETRKLIKSNPSGNNDAHIELCKLIDEQVKEKRRLLLLMYKELKDKERNRFSSLYDQFSLTREQVDEYCKYVPKLYLDPRARRKPDTCISLFTSLHSNERQHQFTPYFYGRSTSTYPYMECKGGREGEPICDQYRVMFSPPTTLLALADGCNWGAAPAEAACKASKAFIEHLHKNRDLFISSNSVAHLCLEGLCAAHNQIISGANVEGKSVGTTTLLGGVVVKVLLDESLDIEHSKDFVFLFASVGDCKAFLWDSHKKLIEELTPDSRGDNFMDASDCGGRIGPYIDGGPDLRNLEVFMSPCVEGDIIFICTDGVHDNFDPQMHGLSPADLCGGNGCKTWNEANAAEANAIKSEWRTAEMRRVMNTNNPDLRKATEDLIEYCERMNLPAQTFMQTNPGKRLPDDYTLFPGKMDHTTLISLRVGDISSTDMENYIECVKNGLHISQPSLRDHLRRQSALDHISKIRSPLRAEESSSQESWKDSGNSIPLHASDDSVVVSNATQVRRVRSDSPRPNSARSAGTPRPTLTPRAGKQQTFADRSMRHSTNLSEPPRMFSFLRKTCRQISEDAKLIAALCLQTLGDEAPRKSKKIVTSSSSDNESDSCKLIRLDLKAERKNEELQSETFDSGVEPLLVRLKENAALLLEKSNEQDLLVKPATSVNNAVLKYVTFIQKRFLGNEQYFSENVNNQNKLTSLCRVVTKGTKAVIGQTRKKIYSLPDT